MLKAGSSTSGHREQHSTVYILPLSVLHYSTLPGPFHFPPFQGIRWKL